MKITIEMESVNDGVEAGMTLKAFIKNLSGTEVPTLKDQVSAILNKDTVPEGYVPTGGGSVPGKSEDSSDDSENTSSGKESTAGSSASNEKVSEKQKRRLIATKKADELGISYSSKMGTAAIEKKIATAEKKDNPSSESGDGKTADNKKKTGKASKVVYDEKKTKLLCVQYMNDMPGETKDKKKDLYGNILEKYGESTKMSEISENDNLQIVGEVLAAHIAYGEVVKAVSEGAAAGAVALIANVTDLTDVPPMLHTALTDALNTVLTGAD